MSFDADNLRLLFAASGVLACVHAVAFPANPLAVARLNVKVFATERVASLAMRFGKLAFSVNLCSDPPRRILGVCYGLQMGRVDAKRIAAQVVKLCARWDWSYKDFVGVAMRPVMTSLAVLRNTECAISPLRRALVAVGVRCGADPVPAIGQAVSLDFGPKSCVVISEDAHRLGRAGLAEIQPPVVVQGAPSTFLGLAVTAAHCTGVHADIIPGQKP